ncbi:hypothetical protein [Aliiroseovarius sp.]|uniref:hypothetical protein n=1 Tax=Aliiroseovarius sp. TaxID=1872442 RepID=UPI003BAD8514
MAGWKKILLGLSIPCLFGVGVWGNLPDDFWEDHCPVPGALDVPVITVEQARAVWGEAAIDSPETVTVRGGAVAFYTPAIGPPYTSTSSQDVARKHCEKLDKLSYADCRYDAEATGRFGYRVVFGDVPGMTDETRFFLGMILLSQADGSHLSLSTDSTDTLKRAECGLARFVQRQADLFPEK